MDAVNSLTVDDHCVGETVSDAAQIQLIGEAWDHTRELSDWDLKLNYPGIVSVSGVL